MKNTEGNVKSNKQKIKDIVNTHGSDRVSAIKELISEGLAITKAQAKRQYFLIKGV